MGTWGYRIVKLPPSKDDKRKDEGKDKLVPHYGICECYYNEDGSVWSRSIEPETIEAWEEDEGDDGPKEIIKTLEMMLADAKKYPVFEDPEKWPKPDHEPTETAKLKTIDTGEIDDIWCAKCGGIMSTTYPYDPDGECGMFGPAQISCWECCHTVTQEQLAEAGMELVEEEEEDDGQDRNKPTEST